MTISDISHLRLRSQRLAGERFDHPVDAVRWLGAVQSQDYPAARWGLGLRLRDADDAAVERAFDEGAILRTHLLRPTWHFVAPEDIRWMLELTAPRVHALAAYQYRKLELDPATMKRAGSVLEKELRDASHRTRDELRDALAAAGVIGDPHRITHIMMHAELEGIVCSGPRRGRQHTYALLEERAPHARRLRREEAVIELARRFFTSHGPATVHDFAKWSGLTVADGSAGVAALGGTLESAAVDRQTYWFAPDTFADATPEPAYLLPNYDEYTVGYRSHDHLFDGERIDNPFFTHTILLDGRIVGTWKRTLKKSEVVIERSFLHRLDKAGSRAVASAAERYGRFLGLEVVLA